MRRLALLPVVLCLAIPVGSPAVGEEDPFECPYRALLAGDDLGLVRVYDGIKKGLEQAALPRVCREDLDEDAAAVLDRLEAEPPALLFVLGPAAAARLGDRLASVPRVYVDTAWFVNGEEQPPSPRPRPPAAVVRSVTFAARVAEVLRELFRERPRGLLSWDASSPALARAAEDLAVAAGFRRAASAEDAEVLLHLRLGLGETPGALAALAETAHASRLLLLSDDIGHWRRGAAVLVRPDHVLLGRIAADAARRLLEAPGPGVARRTVGVSEVWVDLEAARAQGVRLPLPFLAGADVLRDAPRRAAR